MLLCYSFVHLPAIVHETGTSRPSSEQTKSSIVVEVLTKSALGRVPNETSGGTAHAIFSWSCF